MHDESSFFYLITRVGGPEVVKENGSVITVSVVETSTAEKHMS